MFRKDLTGAATPPMVTAKSLTPETRGKLFSQMLMDWPSPASSRHAEQSPTRPSSVAVRGWMLAMLGGVKYSQANVDTIPPRPVSVTVVSPGASAGGAMTLTTVPVLALDSSVDTTPATLPNCTDMSVGAPCTVPQNVVILTTVPPATDPSMGSKLGGGRTKVHEKAAAESGRPSRKTLPANTPARYDVGIVTRMLSTRPVLGAKPVTVAPPTPWMLTTICEACTTGGFSGKLDT
mmetsp:Transcript_27236/g.67177  ORF Transcript_27236/g.67177 Transcript_27236/m.67177 type:complete len:235 (-) Transcript_27236:3882-4586(-)